MSDAEFPDLAIGRDRIAGLGAPAGAGLLPSKAGVRQFHAGRQARQSADISDMNKD
jgi:hypothetical protein